MLYQLVFAFILFASYFLGYDSGLNLESQRLRHNLPVAERKWPEQAIPRREGRHLLQRRFRGNAHFIMFAPIP